MDLGAPHRIVRSATDLDVVRVLAGTGGAMTGRRVARLAGAASQTTVLRSLNRLVELGIVHVAEAGSASMFSLNREHLATPALLAVVDLRRRLIEELSSGVAALDPRPRVAVLFGSAARADGDAGSDIDLLLIGDSAEADAVRQDQIDRLAAHVERISGNRLSVHRLISADLDRLDAEGASVLAEIARDAVTLLGDLPAQLRAAAP